jgi:hypothetical protein
LKPLAVAVAFLWWSGPGCVSNVPVHGEDRNVFFPDLRATWSLDDPAPADEAVFRSFIDADVTYGRGNSQQTLFSGQTLELESVVYTGPGTVDAEYGLLLGSVSWRGGLHFPGGTRFESILGLGFSALEIELSDGTQRDQDSFFEVGPIMGLALGQEVERLTLECSLEIQFGIPDEGTGVTVTVFELGGDYAISKPIRLGVAWRWIDYETEQSVDSNVELELSGPVLTLTYAP